MNRIIIILFIVSIAVLAAPCKLLAQVTANWTGAVSNAWGTAGNWSTGTVPGTTDSVKIGFVHYSRQPVISANARAAYMLFGGSVADTLTVDSGYSLIISGNIVQGHNTDNAAPSTLLRGGGSIYCDSLIVGNNVLPRVVGSKKTTFVSTVGELGVNGNLVIRSCTIDLLSGGLAHNNSLFSLEGGELRVFGCIFLDNFIPPYLSSWTRSKPLSKFQININSSNNATLYLAADSSIVVTHTGCDSIDFYRYVSGTGKSTVVYSGVGQVLYTNNTAGLDTLPYTYQNLTVSGEGSVVAGTRSSGNILNVGGDLYVAYMLDLQSFNAACTVYGNYINRGETDIGSAGITFKGPSFVNYNAFNSGTGVVTFSGGTQTLRDSTISGTNLGQVAFANTGTKHIAGGTFAVVPNGRASLSNNVTVAVDTAGIFILRSDGTGTAAITPIPAGSVITGIINAELFMKGDYDINYRGYRFVSAPVNHNGKTDGTGVYNLNWLKGTTLTDGTLLNGVDSTANGFDFPANATGPGPSLYLWREDVSTNNSTFTDGQNKGIHKINYTDIDSIGTQKRFTFGAIPDTTVYLPIGNGVLAFFLGNRVVSNGTTTGTKRTAPFNYPESVVFTNRGTANQGQVQVRLYYRSNNYLSYTHSSSINNSGNRGYNRVGNPYPSAINWDNFSATDSTASIYGPGLKGTILIYNPFIKGFGSYTADPSHDRNLVYNGTNGSTNVVPSGQGFFVQVDPTSPDTLTASLRFREPAKFNPPLSSGGGGGDMAMMTRKVAAVLSPVTQKLKVNLQQNAAAVAPKEQSLGLKLLRGEADMGQIAVNFLAKGVITGGPGMPPEDIWENVAPPLLASYTAVHTRATVNSIPLPSKTARIPLYVGAPETGSYQLYLYTVKNLPAAYSIKLEDQLKKITVDLRKNNRYSFNIDKTNKLSYGDRFTLIITPRVK